MVDDYKPNNTLFTVPNLKSNSVESKFGATWKMYPTTINRQSDSKVLIVESNPIAKANIRRWVAESKRKFVREIRHNLIAPFSNKRATQVTIYSDISRSTPRLTTASKQL